MKRNVLSVLAVSLTLMAGACKSNTEDAREDIVEATEQQAEANAEYESAKAADTSDYAILKAKTKKMIADNDKRIAEFRLKASKESADNKAKLDAQIDKLDAKNEQLKSDLEAFGDKADEKWDAFKARVNKSVDDIQHDIDEYKRKHNYD